MEKKIELGKCENEEIWNEESLGTLASVDHLFPKSAPATISFYIIFSLFLHFLHNFT